MGKVQKKHEYPENVINNDKFIGTKENIASMFKEFFTKVGPDLAKNITTPVGSSVFDYLKIEMTTPCFCHQLMKKKFIRLLKTAKTKAGNKENCTNYRPISLLPQFSKILEKLFNTRLSAFVDKYKVINPNQYGFRENMSTSYALTELVNEITASLDSKMHTMGVFIDLTKKLLIQLIINCFVKKLSSMVLEVWHIIG